ncbi:MAG TPA: hydroxymethylglutaryl-CoA reductase [Spirochaetota bacterium]|nr:hydroxymethylglutaryl-CoA reductase [Spirochaetota bacterium]
MNHRKSLEELELIPGKDMYSEEARLERLEYLRRMTGKELNILEKLSSFNPEDTKGRIENLVGSIEIPVGIAGPLFIRGEKEDGLCFAPMATVEGTLVASTNRGARALTQSGGVTARVISRRMMRAPFFVFSDLLSSIAFAAWLTEHAAEIKAVAATQTRHGKLEEIIPRIMGRIVHVNFLYSTGDAAGQNLSTKCTAAICIWISGQVKDIESIGLEESFIEGNMASDKKATHQSFISGRGTRIVAEGVLKEKFIRETLNTNADDMHIGYIRGVTGAIQSGMLGYTINLSNVIAAIFAATGQDIASTHESGMGHFYVEKTGEGDLYVSLLIPSLVIGTIGGGTKLPGQAELLDMNNCAGEGKVNRLAEIIAGFCLSLDISTMAAVASNQFAASHRKYG